MKKGYSSKENLAYNLDLFEPKVKQPVIKAENKAENKAELKTKPKFISVKSVAAFLILIVTVGFILAGYAKVSELTAQAASLQKQLTQLEAEEQRLNLELGAKTNLKAIDDIAKNQLNMAKIQSYQIEYVGLNRTDKTQILKTSPLSSAIAVISQGISSVKEYLK
jgi:cell division protein FtsL